MPVPMERLLVPICKLFCQQGFHSVAFLQLCTSLIMRANLAEQKD